MTPETLDKIGFALYGPIWKARLASAWGTNDRTIRRWASGQNEIPEWVPQALMELAQKRADEIAVAMITLEKMR